MRKLCERMKCRHGSKEIEDKVWDKLEEKRGGGKAHEKAGARISRLRRTGTEQHADPGRDREDHPGGREGQWVAHTRVTLD